MKNNFHKKALYCLTGILSCTSLSCGIKFSSEKTIKKITEVSQPKVQVEAEESKPDLVLTGDDPLRYQAEIKWPKNLDNVSIFLNGTLFFKSPSKDVTNCFIGLDHNQEYKIQIYRILSSKKDGVDSTSPAATPIVRASPLPTSQPNQDEQVLVAEWTIKTPLDIIVSRISPMFGFEIPWNLKAHRAFIDEEIPVVTNGFDLKIDTDELIILKNSKADTNQELKFDSNKKVMESAATIETFTLDGMNQRYPPSSRGLTSEFWVDGKDGGTITIKAKKASGRLNIYLRGQNGANGFNGAPYTDDDRGPRGADGFPAKYTECSHFSGIGVRNICNCTKESEDNENGHRGEKGNPGHDGSNGGRGGDTGIVKLEIAELSPEFHFSITQDFGVSGKPGIAGPPQKGGLGGHKMEAKQRRDINPFIDLVCKEPIDEGDGPLGDKGNDGVKQRNGVIEQNCYSIGEGFGRCAN